MSLIVAYAKNRVIGRDNAMPWHLPEDLKRFKALTMGHHIIMGRKTYESLGRLLPGRTTIIVTRNPQLKVPGVIVATSLEAALELASGDTEIFIIGGAELYRTGLVHADKLYVTEIDAEYVGDTFFPEINSKNWQEISREALTSANGLAYSNVIYVKK